MRIARAVLLCAVVVAAGVLLVSGGSDAGPRTPAAVPGLPPPFLGTAVTGNGGLTAAVDAYGDVVDLRAGPAGAALIDNPSDRQAAGTVPAKTGIVPRMSVGDSPPLPMWRATKVTQHYRRYSSVIETTAYVKGARLITLTAAAGDSLAIEMIPGSSRQGRGRAAISVEVEDGVNCEHARRADVINLLCRVGRPLPPSGPGASRQLFRECDRVIREAGVEEHHWFARSTPLDAAPRWARAMYKRSLLTVHALTSRKTGAVAAGARDGWAYVWPRDAATAALALAASGHHAEARRVAKFLTGLDLDAAARFTESGAPVPGRAAQGDAFGWVTAAARATGIKPPRGPYAWEDRADYQESTAGNYLGNALAAAGADVDGPKTADIGGFSARQHGGLVRVEGEPGSGLDSAAGWAVRPFRIRGLYPDAERTLLALVKQGTRYGITPGEGWEGGDDPWTAPTAWSAWALAALGRTGGRDPRTSLPAVREGGGPSRRAALELLTDLRRAATPAGDLPERVGVHTGIPTSTTPLLWSSAFTVLALRELWP
jgi:hypothetical protein